MTTIRPNAEPAATTVAAGDTFLIDGATGVRALAAASVAMTNTPRVSPPPATKTAAYSQTAADSSLIFNGAASITLTLLPAASVPGQTLRVKTTAAFTVVSASANVVPLAGGAAGTAILAATAGKWAELQSDGSNWVIMAAN